MFAESGLSFTRFIIFINNIPEILSRNLGKKQHGLFDAQLTIMVMNPTAINRTLFLEWNAGCIKQLEPSHFMDNYKM